MTGDSVEITDVPVSFDLMAMSKLTLAFFLAIGLFGVALLLAGLAADLPFIGRPFAEATGDENAQSQQNDLAALV